MSSGILAHLSGRIAKQQELLATEGLSFLLQKSASCRDALRILLKQANVKLADDLVFRTEVSGENLERPDIVVLAASGSEVGLIEGKFDAGLTDNQPNQYLSRLTNSTGGFLLFVVPERRLNKLWREVELRAKQAGHCGPLETYSNAVGCTFDDNCKILMTSWVGLLSQMQASATYRSDEIAPDVSQLLTLCKRIEGELFFPFSHEELTSTNYAKRNMNLCDLVDAVVETLRRDGQVKLDGLRATGTRSGYVRYVWLGSREINGGAALSLDYEAWMKFGDSPVWLSPQNSGIAAQRPIYQRIADQEGFELRSDGERPMLPLPISPNFEFQELVQVCRARVRKVIDQLQEQSAQS